MEARNVVRDPSQTSERLKAEEPSLGCRRLGTAKTAQRHWRDPMNRIELIGAPFSSYVWVVRMALEEKGVPYDLVPAAMHSPEVLAIHPFGKIPVMRHGDLALCESKAITTYIDKTFSGPKLIPDDARGSAEVEQWVSLVNTTIDPCLIRTYLFAYLIPRGAGGQPDRAAIDAVLPAMQQQIHVLDRAVGSTGYLAGDSFSLADIYLLPVLHLVQRGPEGAEMVQSTRNLSAYFTTHARRRSYRASLPPPPTAEAVAAIRKAVSEKRGGGANPADGARAD